MHVDISPEADLAERPLCVLHARGGRKRNWSVCLELGGCPHGDMSWHPGRCDQGEPSAGEGLRKGCDAPGREGRSLPAWMHPAYETVFTSLFCFGSLRWYLCRLSRAAMTSPRRPPLPSVRRQGRGGMSGRWTPKLPKSSLIRSALGRALTRRGPPRSQLDFFSRVLEYREDRGFFCGKFRGRGGA